MGLFGPPNVEKMKAKGDVKGLIKALDYQKDVSVRQAAARVLGELKDARAVESLIVALEDSDSNVRQTVASALGHIGDARAVEPLIAMHKEDREWETREAAAKALGAIGDARAVEPLIAALDRFAASALGQIGDARAVEPLIAALKDVLVREEAADALGRIGVPAIEPLIAALDDNDKYAREAAARVLGEIVARLEDAALRARAVESLIAALKNGNSSAASALGQIGDARAVEPLIAALKNGNGSAASALGQIGDARAVEPLITMLHHKDKYVRIKAAESLLIFYRQKNIDDQAKEKILVERNVITKPHSDGGCFTHVDVGIGVEFPL